MPSGRFGSGLHPLHMQQPELTLSAIVEPDIAAKQEAAAMGAAWFSSLEEMFAASPIDGVILSTPTLLHVEQAISCIEHDCPVLVEKPIAATTREAARLVAAANEANVPLLVGHHRRYNGTVRAAKAAIESGIIGELRAVNATCWFYKPDYYFEQAPWRTR